MKRISWALVSGFLFAFAVSAGPVGVFDTSGAGIFASGGQVSVYFVTQSASFSNDLLLTSPAGAFSGVIFNNHAASPGASVNLGNFAAGTELIFGLHVLDTGNLFFTGAASRNPDNHVHAATQSWVADGLVPANGLYVQFEDLFNGPFVYNDLDFVFTNVTIAQPPGTDTPEPATTLPAGVALIGGAIILRRGLAR